MCNCDNCTVCTSSGLDETIIIGDLEFDQIVVTNDDDRSFKTTQPIYIFHIQHYDNENMFSLVHRGQKYVFGFYDKRFPELISRLDEDYNLIGIKDHCYWFEGTSDISSVIKIIESYNYKTTLTQQLDTVLDEMDDVRNYIRELVYEFLNNDDLIAEYLQSQKFSQLK